ncbi:MAG: cytidylate kinase-like family protein [Desulfobacteraceae bacterium]|nr:cytidylate kinase-like family protein [Desulfobacteraceae bacterium]
MVNQIIREIAFEESCVIVGRCADFILKDHPLCFRIFIYASYDSRKKQIMQRLNVNTSDAEKMISEIDHERENYCRYYTGKHWREMNRYDLAVNSSLFDYQSIAQIIAEAAEKYISIR